MHDVGSRRIWFVNRGIVVVRPARPFVDWVLALDEGDGLSAEEVFASSNAFLVPEVDPEADVWPWVQESCETMFEYMLHDWIALPEAWPEDRGWTSFLQWFTVEHIPIAWDLVDGPLTSDPPEVPEDITEWDA